MPTKALSDLETRLALTSTIEEIAAAVIVVGRRLIGCDGVTFVVNENGFCNYMDESGISPLWKGQKFPAESCVSGWVMRNRQAVIIPNIHMDPRIPQDVYRRTFVKSMQMVPVGERGEAAIGAYWAEYHDPSDDESMVLYGLARLTAVAMARLQPAV